MSGERSSGGGPIPPTEPASRLERLAPELPLVVGILVSWVLLVNWGRAFMLMPIPVGPDWNQYYMAAWKVAHGVAEDYPEFRAPLYPWMIATLGARQGYVVASVVLSSLGVFLMAVAAGLGARALSGGWAAGLAALSIPFVATTTESARWASEYPVLAAVSGLAMALGAGCARWPGVALAAAAGLASGLDWGIDARGGHIAVASFCMVLLAATRPALRWKRFLLPVVFGLLFAAGPLIQHELEVIPRPSSQHLVKVQRRMAIQDIREMRPAGLYDVCAGLDPEQVGLLEALATPCAEALFEHNSGSYGVELPFGLMLTLLFLPLCLLPGRQGWRGSAASVFFFGTPVAVLAVVARLIDVPPRYLVQYACLAAAIVPVGVARLIDSVVAPVRAVRAPRVTGVVCVLAGAWLAFVGPGERRTVRELTNYSQLQQVQGRLMYQIERHVEPGDRLLDCSHNLRVEVAMLPNLHDPNPETLRESPDDRRCRDWLVSPPAKGVAAWLVTDGQGFLRPDQRPGWRLTAAVRLPDHQGYLWRWDGE